jgi:hypothetical protein
MSAAAVSRLGEGLLRVRTIDTAGGPCYAVGLTGERGPVAFAPDWPREEPVVLVAVLLKVQTFRRRRWWRVQTVEYRRTVEQPYVLGRGLPVVFSSGGPHGSDLVTVQPEQAQAGTWLDERAVRCCEGAPVRLECHRSPHERGHDTVRD